MLVAVNRVPFGPTPYLRSPLLLRCIEAISNLAAVCCAMSACTADKAMTIRVCLARRKANFGFVGTYLFLLSVRGLRLHPGILFEINPERRSESSRKLRSPCPG